MGVISTIDGIVLIEGAATAGELLRLRAPISFWGGVDAGSGRITQAHHPDHGACVAGRVLAVPELIGSSSSSAILLELLYAGKAPRALLLAKPDAILPLGVVVAKELGYPTIPVVRCCLDRLESGMTVTISATGRITVEA